MSDQPLVTIITPCWNSRTWLPTCLASIRSQTYPRIEHIVVDAASTDGTVELLQEQEETRWISEPDEGQADAINKGLRLANGEILGWLNADDTLEPHAIERIVAAFSSDPRIGWVYGDCEQRWSDRTKIWRAPPTVTPGSFDDADPIPQPSTYVARWAYEQVGGLDERFDLAMDLDWWLRLAVADIPSRHIPEVLSVFHLHDECKSEAVPRSRFMRENALARAGSGRHRPAAVALGLSAAEAARQGDTVDRDRLARELDDAIRWLNGMGQQVPTRLVRATAATAAASFDRANGMRRLRHLARAEPWMWRETRKMIRRGASGPLTGRARQRGNLEAPTGV